MSDKFTPQLTATEKSRIQQGRQLENRSPLPNPSPDVTQTPTTDREGGQKIVGTNRNDFLVGTQGNDYIEALGGNDGIVALAGNDTIKGGSGEDNGIAGSGNDVFSGGDGSDLFLGGAGNDFAYGGNQVDVLIGDDGDDMLFGEAGNDSILGDKDDFTGNGNDFASGGSGDDKILGGDGNDTLHGDAGSDQIDGGGDNDLIRGGDGNDGLLFGNLGNDTIYGDRGNDTVAGGPGNDQVFGGLGSDRVIGVNPLVSAFGLGKGEIDVLTGDEVNVPGGNDVFVLGGVLPDGSKAVFYNDGDPLTSGTQDYALIADFGFKGDGLKRNVDKIELAGSPNSYSLGASPGDLPGGTAIFFNDGVNGSTPELIAIVQGIDPSRLSLGNSAQFQFV